MTETTNSRVKRISRVKPHRWSSLGGERQERSKRWGHMGRAWVTTHHNRTKTSTTCGGAGEFRGSQVGGAQVAVREDGVGGRGLGE